MVLDTALLYTQRYRARIKSKVERPWEWSCALSVVAIEKGSFGYPSTKVTNFTYVYNIIFIDNIFSKVSIFHIRFCYYANNVWFSCSRHILVRFRWKPKLICSEIYTMNVQKLHFPLIYFIYLFIDNVTPNVNTTRVFFSVLSFISMHKWESRGMKLYICRCLPPDTTWHKVKSPKAD